jgi:hypothetical protein
MTRSVFDLLAAAGPCPDVPGELTLYGPTISGRRSAATMRRSTPGTSRGCSRMAASMPG